MLEIRQKGSNKGLRDFVEGERPWSYLMSEDMCMIRESVDPVKSTIRMWTLLG